MKHTILMRTIACCMAGSLFVGTAVARQDAGDAGGFNGSGNGGASQPPAPGYQSLSPSSSRPQQQSERLSQLMGATVKDPQGNSIGQINDFVVNPMSGRIQFAVISLNDQSGKLTAVPWQLMRQGSDPTVCVVTAAKDKLENAQTFDASSWPDFTQPSTGQEIYSHYGVQPMPGRTDWRNQGGTGENQTGHATGTGNNGTSNNNTGNSGNNPAGTGNSGTGTSGKNGNPGNGGTPRTP